ncbi:MAG: tetratricopeptide repeat protein [bacterium]
MRAALLLAGLMLPASSPHARTTRPPSRLWARMVYPAGGAYAAAVAQAETLLSRRPWTTQQRQRARALLRRAVHLSPRRPEAHRLLGDLLGAEGRWAHAAKAYDRARTLDPTYLPRNLGYRFAMAAARAGRFAAAGAALLQLVRGTDSARMTAVLWNNAAESYLAAGYLRRAITLYHKARARDRTYPTPLYGLAVAYHRDGRPLLGRSTMAAALRADPGMTRLTGKTAVYFPAAARHYHLALAWESRGQTARAADAWKAFLAADASGPWVLQARAALARLTTAPRPRARRRSGRP